MNQVLMGEAIKLLHFFKNEMSLHFAVVTGELIASVCASCAKYAAKM